MGVALKPDTDSPLVYWRIINILHFSGTKIRKNKSKEKRQVNFLFFQVTNFQQKCRNMKIVCYWVACHHCPCLTKIIISVQIH